MSKQDNNDLNNLEQHLEAAFDEDDFDITESTVAMVPSSVIAAITNFIVDNFGECAFETFMEYFPVNASALLSEDPLFRMGGVELVFDKPFKDLIHLLTHLHPDFSKVMDAAAMEASNTPANHGDDKGDPTIQ